MYEEAWWGPMAWEREHMGKYTCGVCFESAYGNGLAGTLWDHLLHPQFAFLLFKICKFVFLSSHLILAWSIFFSFSLFHVKYIFVLVTKFGLSFSPYSLFFFFTLNKYIFLVTMHIHFLCEEHKKLFEILVGLTVVSIILTLEVCLVCPIDLKGNYLYISRLFYFSRS